MGHTSTEGDTVNHLSPRFDNAIVNGDNTLTGFARNLWLAATANHEARHDPDSRTVIPVRSNREATELAAMVVDYAHKAFRLNLRHDGDLLVWPNGATLEISVTGRQSIRGARPSLTLVDEALVLPAEEKC